ncbi:MAG TPA: LLM class F420-dependent oxidoreductase [Pseudomonadales bacterium]|nr:LLM class F420-dependent oxidoreductase [Pseudomonadales bacterium]
MPALRIGTTLPVFPDIAANVDHALWAESEDLELWLADGGGPDALTLAAVLAARTSRVRIGVAVTPVFTRTPASLASAVRVLAEVSEGRFVLGVGASSATIVEDWHGVEFVRPLTRVKETVALLRTMLAGEKTDFEGRTLRSHGYRQGATRFPVPILLAALRGNMLSLAGEIGDGAVLNLAPRDVLQDLVTTMRGGVPEDENPMDREVVLRHHVLVTDDPAAARESFRRKFTSYLATGVYNRFLAWCGQGEIAGDLEAAWTRGDREATRRALTDELIDSIAAIGSEDHCRAALREAIDAGVHTHILVPLSEDPAAIRRTQAALTPAALGL